MKFSILSMKHVSNKILLQNISTYRRCKKRKSRANHRVSFHYPSTIPSPTPSTTIAPRHCRPAPHPPTSPAPPPVPSCFERQHAMNQPFFRRIVDVSANRLVPIAASPVMFAAPRWVAPHHRTTTSPAAPPTDRKSVV